MSSRVYQSKKRKGAYSKGGTQSVGFTKRVMGSSSVGNKNKGELKALDTLIDNYVGAPVAVAQGTGGIFSSALSAAQSLFLLNNVGVGSAFYQRIGRKIDLKSLEFKLCLRPNAGTTGATASTGGYGNLSPSTTFAPYLRILVVYDMQANGGYPTLSDVLNSVDSISNPINIGQSMINLNNRERFKILRDHEMTPPVFVTDPTANPGTKLQALGGVVDEKRWDPSFSDYIKLKGLPCQYKADAAPNPSSPTIGNLATGALYLILLSDRNTLLTGWTAYGTCRLRYYDT